MGRYKGKVPNDFSCVRVGKSPHKCAAAGGFALRMCCGKIYASPNIFTSLISMYSPWISLPQKYPIVLLPHNVRHRAAAPRYTYFNRSQTLPLLHKRLLIWMVVGNAGLSSVYVRDHQLKGSITNARGDKKSNFCTLHIQILRKFYLEPPHPQEKHIQPQTRFGPQILP